MQNKDAELLHAPFAQFPVHRISFRREPTMNADRDRLWNAERNVSPLASGLRSPMVTTPRSSWKRRRIVSLLNPHNSASSDRE